MATLFLIASPSLKLEDGGVPEKKRRSKGRRGDAVLQSSSHQPNQCEAVLAPYARHCLPHTLVWTLMSVHCIVSLITLCYALPQYTLHPDSCLSCSAPWWQLGLSLASEEKRFFKLEFKFSNSKYLLASGRNIKVVKFGTIFFSNQHLKRYYRIFWKVLHL